MSFSPITLRILGIFLFAFGLTSCVKDVDLNQAENIRLKPKLQTDLLIFDVEESDFVDSITKEIKTVIRDTVRLEFLDDDYIQENLKEVQFSFQYVNHFPHAFNSSIYFLSESNNLQHRVDFFLPASRGGSPTVTERIEIIPEERIHEIRRTIKMVVELNAIKGNEPFIGKIHFQSKGLFIMEF